MPPTTTQLTPMVSVASVPRAAAFYAQFGFEVDNDFVPPGQDERAWAWLRSRNAHLMVARTTQPIDPGAQRALFYVYVTDVVAMHEILRASGADPGPITPRFYAPAGEFEVRDPDGHTLMVMQAG